jgi:hypothetical protein
MTTFEIAVFAAALYVGGFGYALRSMVRGSVYDPYVDEEIAREQEWTVDDRDLPDFNWMLAR